MEKKSEDMRREMKRVIEENERRRREENQRRTREERTNRYPTNPVSEELTKYWTDLEVHSPPEGYIMAI